MTINFPELPDPFPSDYEKFIATSRYVKWIEEKNRREAWPETVQRLINYYVKRVPEFAEAAEECYKAIHDLTVVPSMRAVATAGLAMDRNDICAYNCCYAPFDNPKAFDEVLYILMCGTGVGYSVEKKYIHGLPPVAETFEETSSVIHVADSKEGWARAFRELVALLYAGQLPTWDVSRVRGAGERLRTFGGRASGPGPLVDLFEFTVRLFRGAAGRRLSSLECHDLMCKIADVVVVGGVRRSSLISLSDADDERLRTAKTGAWWVDAGHRALANNSAVYTTKKPDIGFFMKEWKALYDSKSGERGFFSRYAAKNIAGRNGRRDTNHDFGCNPCLSN